MGEALSRAARIGRAGWVGAALLVAGLTRPAATQTTPPLSGYSTVTVGQVTALAKPADLDLAVALAEAADRPASWYGIGSRSVGQMALVVVRGAGGFSEVAKGRAPDWGAGLAIPAARFVVVRADGEDPFRVLRHELAHLVLHQVVPGRVPLWFDEGYAVVAAGEFSRFVELSLNLTVARGRIPPLGQLSNELRSDRSTAETAYALAGSAVSFLVDRTPERSLAPLLARLRTGISFDSAVTLSTGMGRDRFEDTWQKAVKKRYGLGLWLAAGGMWFAVAGMVVAAYWLRRKRDVPRRAQLDVDWVIPVDVPSSDEAAPESRDRA